MKELVCKWCRDEFCVNDQCPMRADYCPVPDTPGVCKYEERIEIQPEPKQRRLTHYECFKKAIDESGYSALDDSTKLLIYDVFCDILKDENWEIVDMTKKDEGSDTNEPKWKPGQFVGIEEISTSSDWVFERKIKDHDIHESIIYVSRDGTLMVYFDDGNDYSTVVLNRTINGKNQETPKFCVGQKVSIEDVQKSKEWTFDGVKRYGSYEETAYVTLDRTLKVSFGDWENDDCGFIQSNRDSGDEKNTEAFKIGQVVELEEIEKSEDWTLKSFSSHPFDNSCSYISKDKTMMVEFGNREDRGTIIPHYSDEQFHVGQHVHVGAIGASRFWMYVGEENDIARYVSRNHLMTVTFRRDSDWGVIMLNQ